MRIYSARDGILAQHLARVWAKREEEKSHTASGPTSGEIHRGITVDLNPEQKNIFDSANTDSKAKMLVSQQPYAGMHWTDDEETANSWAHNPDAGDPKEGHTRFHVVMHAQHPGEEHVFQGDRSPRNRNPVFQYDYEWETPLKPGAPVDVHGVSWLDSRSPGYQELAPHDWTMHEPDAWTHHSFDKPIRTTATVDGGGQMVRIYSAADDFFTSSIGAPDEKDSQLTRYDFPKPIRVKAAQEAPSYYHGTTLENPSHILPADTHGGHVTFPSDTSRQHAYATTNLDDAWDYAEKAFHASNTGIPRVYRVEPLGEVEKDPDVDEKGNWRSGVNESDVRSKDGFKVLHEMPMPEHMGEPEDWR